MQASAGNPIYTAFVVSGGKKYDLSSAVESIRLSEEEKQVAASAAITLLDVAVDGKKLSEIISVRDRVYIYADDGTRNDEVFRGFVWTISGDNSLKDRTLGLKCYDQLIYFQESQESEFFASGKSTKDVVSSLCSKWGVTLQYDYDTITHSKLALRGNLSDILTADVLDLVKDKTGKKYVIRSEKDVVQVRNVGKNSTVYTIEAGNNAISVQSACTMDGMTTKVVILGKSDGDERPPVEATISGDTAKYGTLQKIISKAENTSLADAKKEAQSLIDENGKPEWEYDVKAPDIPWIREGDKVKVNAGGMNGDYIVKGIDRDISNKSKTMTLTLENV